MAFENSSCDVRFQRANLERRRVARVEEKERNEENDRQRRHPVRIKVVKGRPSGSGSSREGRPGRGRQGKEEEVQVNQMA